MLNDFGRLAIAEIVLYAPLLILGLAVAFRYGFARKEGWILLVLFMNARIVGSIMLVITQTQSKPSTGLLVATGIVQSLGLSPLLLACLAFVSTIIRQGYPALIRVTHLLHLTVTAGLVLGIIGGVKSTPDHTTSERNSGLTFSRVATVLFLGAFLATVSLHVMLLGVRRKLADNHQRFLGVISFALPFLFVRVLYSLLGAFIKNPPNFSPTVGDWRINLGMVVVVELITICTYIYGGYTIPLQQDSVPEYKQAYSNEYLGLRGVYRP